MTNLHTVLCHTAGMGGIVLLEEKIVSNSQIAMFVTDFNHIVLACKRALNYMQKEPLH